jgi:hypothetical protein
MRSAAECLAKAKELTARAALNPEIGPQLLELAEEWLDLARVAEWQDEFVAQHIPDFYHQLR